MSLPTLQLSQIDKKAKRLAVVFSSVAVTWLSQCWHSEMGDFIVTFKGYACVNLVITSLHYMILHGCMGQSRGDQTTAQTDCSPLPMFK